MSKLVSGIFGGGDNGAARAAKQSRELSQVAADRQAAELRRDSQNAAISRRRPRGRRLFADEGGKTNLS